MTRLIRIRTYAASLLGEGIALLSHDGRDLIPLEGIILSLLVDDGEKEVLIRGMVPL